MIVVLYLLGAVLLILTNTFFVALEFSLITASHSYLNNKSEEGDRRATYALNASKNLPKYLAGAQLGITISTVALGFIAEPAVAELIDSVPIISHAVAAILALLLVTFIQMVVGEIVPKNVALSDPEKAALRLAGPHIIFVRMLNPLIWMLDKMTSAGVRLLGVSPTSQEAARTPVELVGAVEESLGGGVIDKFDYDLLTGALDLGEMTVGRHMVSRPNITHIQPNATVRQIEDLAVNSGHSRLPMMISNLKEVVGFVHTKDLLSIPEAERDERIDPELVRPALNLIADCPLDEALLLMKKERKHLAIVLDRRKNILGLITIEDVLEFLVGEFPED